MPKHEITPNNFLCLKELLYDDEESYADYLYLENLVKANIFSKYSERKEYALKKLKEFFNPHAKIHTLEDSTSIYTYISITKAEEAFFFVGKYKKNSIQFEIIPDNEEIKTWKKYI